jgi:hypothetical protein
MDTRLIQLPISRRNLGLARSALTALTLLSASAAPVGAKPVKSVTLLGYTGTLTWKQAPDALVVTLPDTSAFKTALGFKIETK